MLDALVVLFLLGGAPLRSISSWGIRFPSPPPVDCPQSRRTSLLIARLLRSCNAFTPDRSFNHSVRRWPTVAAVEVLAVAATTSMRRLCDLLNRELARLGSGFDELATSPIAAMPGGSAETQCQFGLHARPRSVSLMMGIPGRVTVCTRTSTAFASPLHRSSAGTPANAHVSIIYI